MLSSLLRNFVKAFTKIEICLNLCKIKNFGLIKNNLIQTKNIKIISTSIHFAPVIKK
jgi:hypothetical protein